MWQDWAETAKSSVAQALDKTGDVISKAATNAGKSLREAAKNSDGNSDLNVTAKPSSSAYDQPTIVPLPSTPAPSQLQQNVQGNITKPAKENPLLTSISQGWFNVVDATVASIRHAEDAIQEQRLMFQEKITKSINVTYQRRDVSLPLDAEALHDAELVYITDRIITMGHPTMDSSLNVAISGRRKVLAIAHLLERRHAGRYMIWNLSEVDYDLEIFHDQVLTYSFPGSPSPPLGLLLKLFISMESWLKADARNVAVVHCLTGKGRTSIVLAAFLCWMGEAQFVDVYEALEYIASCKQVTLDDLTIPSQRRYASYFKNMLDGVRPSQPPLLLKRIIMSEAPNFAKGPSRSATNEINSSDEQLGGCLPYVQIFKAGILLHTAPASLHFQQAVNEIPFCYTSDGNISFNVNLSVQGDILVRVRHLTPNKKRISMFRAAFHTGYAPPNVMRFSKSQLDGACSDDRFTSDFFVDFIFEPIDAEEASKMISNNNTEIHDANPNDTNNESNNDKIRKAVQASAEDSMLYGDSRFWDVISNRMKENASQTTTNKNDPMFGPTVGRRRDRESSKLMDPTAPSNESEITGEIHGRNTKHSSRVFSIGGEIDFLPVSIQSVSTKMEHLNPYIKNPGTLVPPPQPKKDSLLEALMGALDDNHDVNDHDDVEIVEFDEVKAITGSKLTNNPITGAYTSNDFILSETVSVAPLESKINDSTGVNTNVQKTSTKSNPPISSMSTSEKIQVSLEEIDSLNSKSAVADDIELLLAGVSANIPQGLSDADLLTLDIDDAELDDLESFLSSTSNQK